MLEDVELLVRCVHLTFDKRERSLLSALLQLFDALHERFHLCLESVHILALLL